jgi:hypothetical protein
VALAVLFALPGSNARCEVPAVQSNLEILQQLGRRIANSLAANLKTGDSVQIVLRPIESAWYLQQQILAAFEEGGKVVNQSSGSRFGVEIGLVNAQIAYLDKRSAGFLDSRVVDRVASLDLSVQIVDKSSGNIVANRTLSESFRDTIEVSDVTTVENPGIPATHGIPPEEGFFNTLLEPFVVVGAIAVAVYLLFHVRS